MCDLYFLFNAFTNKKHKQKGYNARSIAINSMYFIFVKLIISSIRLRCLEKPLSNNKLFSFCCMVFDVCPVFIAWSIKTGAVIYFCVIDKM